MRAWARRVLVPTDNRSAASQSEVWMTLIMPPPGELIALPSGNPLRSQEHVVVSLVLWTKTNVERLIRSACRVVSYPE